MRKRSLAARLGRWLPENIFQDLYQPSVADLERERIEAGRSRARCACLVLVVWMQCLALAFKGWLERPSSRHPDQCPNVRKEPASMVARDLRHAFRIFLREPSFSAAAIFTLMLGIGANTALFAVVEAVLLRPLPYADAERIVVLRHRDVRTTADPLLAWPPVRTTIRDIERHAVFVETRTLDHVAQESAAITRLAMRVLGGFAAIALALAAVGIYGVMSYSVRRRTRELGTRVALGASCSDIVRLVMRQAAMVAALGLSIGIAAGLAGARALSSILFGVPAWDPVAIGAAATVLTATALLASYVPARRAARIDPAATLVSE